MTDLSAVALTVYVVFIAKCSLFFHISCAGGLSCELTDDEFFPAKLLEDIGKTSLGRSQSREKLLENHLN